MMFVCDHEPTEQELEVMYEDYMRQYIPSKSKTATTIKN